ncbi:hypothetical protein [Azorhizobium caulinodans]|uniref:VpaChn25_0724 family phage protein n=1 Tax=Azorhizobium caulinodans TaxID=7 RepID=UPI002FBD4BF1
MSERENSLREEARLIMLRALSEETDETLNSSLLERELRSFGIKRERAWVHAELDYMEQMGAITLTSAGSVKVAQLTRRGTRHLAREIIIEGINRPSQPVS